MEIPAGSFTMGSPYDPDYLYESETPQHTVTIAQPFQIGKFEVTQAQWWAVLGSMPSHFTGPSLPVENVSWDDCQGFISKLNTMGKGSFRLPSEAEWEYACRAGSTTRWYYGQDPATLGDYAWYSNNQTYPVGQRLPNAFGLYDMSGNVWEWCQDWYHFTYEGAPGDGTAWILPTWSSRVLRGGAWNGYANYSRSAYRHTDVPSNGNPGYGMRVVRTP